MITVLYFATAARDARPGLGADRAARERAQPGGLRALLVARGGAWEEELAQNKPVRAAVNQAMAHGDRPLPTATRWRFSRP